MGISLGPILGVFKWVTGEVSKWSERRDRLSTARLEAEVASFRAKAEIAAYKIKSDIEWDLKWASSADMSWKDEFMLILWAFPMIGLFIPDLRPFVMDGFDYLKTFHEEAPTWYMAGWAIIFSATFGMKSAMKFMLPARAARLATVFGGLEDDIPMDVVKAAQERIAPPWVDPDGPLRN